MLPFPYNSLLCFQSLEQQGEDIYIFGVNDHVLRPHEGATHLQIYFYAATGKRSSDGAVDQSALRLQISSVSCICKPISDSVTLGNGLEDFQDGARKHYGLVRDKQTRCFRYKYASDIL